VLEAVLAKCVIAEVILTELFIAEVINAEFVPAEFVPADFVRAEFVPANFSIAVYISLKLCSRNCPRGIIAEVINPNCAPRMYDRASFIAEVINEKSFIADL
jgi:hypothetical protein